jgi:hypothetical protein
MSADSGKAPPRRVLVVFESALAGDAELAAAVGLAQQLSAELAGLFIEDVNLMRMAALPFATELGRVSAVPRPISAQDVEREFRRQAEGAREALRAAAATLELAWSFAAVRGAGLRPAFDLAREPDLMVVAKGRRPLMAVPARGAAPALPVAVLFDGSEGAFRALETAHLLADSARVPLLVLISAPDRAAFERMRTTAAAWADERGLKAHSVWLREVGPAAVCAAAKEHHAAMLFLHERVPPRDESAYARLLAGAPCPVVLVS